MLLSEIKNAVCRFGFSDDDPLLAWINHAYLNFVLMSFPWPFLEASPVVIPVAAGTASIVLPNDLHRIATIKDMTSGFTKLKPMERTEFEREIDDPSASGYPYYYVMTGLTSVDVAPIPSVNTDFRVVYLTSRDPLVDDTDVPDVPRELDYAIVQAAAAIGLQAENEEDRSQNAESQAQNSCSRVWNRFSGSASRDEPRQVKDTAGYGC